MSESSSDSEDCDYIPGNESASEVSDAEDFEKYSDSDAEETEEANEAKGKSGKKKRRKCAKAANEKEDSGEAEAKPVYDKQRADELWASFMAPKPQKNAPVASSAQSTAVNHNNTNGKQAKVEASAAVIPPKNDSAGVAAPRPTNALSSTLTGADTASDTRPVATNGVGKATQPVAASSTASASATVGNDTKRKAGIDGVLAFINKKQKLSTLEKSKLDWDTFKRETNINEDLKTFNRGKQGYLEKQAFLERTDYRVYEQERDIRLKQMSKRLGSGSSKLE